MSPMKGFSGFEGLGEELKRRAAEAGGSGGPATESTSMSPTEETSPEESGYVPGNYGFDTFLKSKERNFNFLRNKLKKDNRIREALSEQQRRDIDSLLKQLHPLMAGKIKPSSVKQNGAFKDQIKSGLGILNRLYNSTQKDIEAQQPLKEGQEVSDDPEKIIGSIKIMAENVAAAIEAVKEQPQSDASMEVLERLQRFVDSYQSFKHNSENGGRIVLARVHERLHELYEPAIEAADKLLENRSNEPILSRAIADVDVAVLVPKRGENDTEKTGKSKSRRRVTIDGKLVEEPLLQEPETRPGSVVQPVQKQKQMPENIARPVERIPEFAQAQAHIDQMKAEIDRMIAERKEVYKIPLNKMKGVFPFLGTYAQYENLVARKELTKETIAVTTKTLEDYLLRARNAFGIKEDNQETPLSANPAETVTDRVIEKEQHPAEEIPRFGILGYDKNQMTFDRTVTISDELREKISKLPTLEVVQTAPDTSSELKEEGPFPTSVVQNPDAGQKAAGGFQEAVRSHVATRDIASIDLIRNREIKKAEDTSAFVEQISADINALYALAEKYSRQPVTRRGVKRQMEEIKTLYEFAQGALDELKSTEGKDAEAKRFLVLGTHKAMGDEVRNFVEDISAEQDLAPWLEGELSKEFHPDLHTSESAKELAQRIESARSSLAQIRADYESQIAAASTQPYGMYLERTEKEDLEKERDERLALAEKELVQLEKERAKGPDVEGTETLSRDETFVSSHPERAPGTPYAEVRKRWHEGKKLLDKSREKYIEDVRKFYETKDAQGWKWGNLKHKVSRLLGLRPPLSRELQEQELVLRKLSADQIRLSKELKNVKPLSRRIIREATYGGLGKHHEEVMARYDRMAAYHHVIKPARDMVALQAEALVKHEPGRFFKTIKGVYEKLPTGMRRNAVISLGVAAVAGVGGVAVGAGALGALGAAAVAGSHRFGRALLGTLVGGTVGTLAGGGHLSRVENIHRKATRRERTSDDRLVTKTGRDIFDADYEKELKRFSDITFQYAIREKRAKQVAAATGFLAGAGTAMFAGGLFSSGDAPEAPKGPRLGVPDSPAKPALPDAPKGAQPGEVPDDLKYWNEWPKDGDITPPASPGAPESPGAPALPETPGDETPPATDPPGLEYEPIPDNPADPSEPKYPSEPKEPGAPVAPNDPAPFVESPEPGSEGYVVEKNDNFWDMLEGETAMERPEIFSEIPEAQHQAFIDLARDYLVENPELRAAIGFAHPEDGGFRIYPREIIDQDLLEETLRHVAQQEGFLSTEETEVTSAISREILSADESVEVGVPLDEVFEALDHMQVEDRLALEGTSLEEILTMGSQSANGEIEVPEHFTEVLEFIAHATVKNPDIDQTMSLGALMESVALRNVSN